MRMKVSTREKWLLFTTQYNFMKCINEVGMVNEESAAERRQILEIGFALFIKVVSFFKVFS